jgi:hypothetical protein
MASIGLRRAQRRLAKCAHQMRKMLSSRIMRTTVDIDDPILHEVKALQEKEGRSLGALVSELLADALARRRAGRPRPAFRWTSRPMKALVDLTDKDAVYAALERDRS